MISEGKEATGQSDNEGFDVGQGAISSSPDVGWGEEAEDILARVWELPELWPC